MPQQKTVDPAIQAARINRRGAVVAAVVAALITGTATGVSAYIAGRKEGVSTASTVTVVHTETVTDSAGADATGTAEREGSTSLLELSPVEAFGTILTDPQKVDTKNYQRVFTAWLGTCGSKGGSASRTYHLDRRYARLQTRIGLSDGSKSGKTVEFRVFVDDRQIDSATARIGLGEVRSLDVDVTNALRVRLETHFLGGECFNEYQAGAVWIEPTIA